jgi:hypothetical protein
MQFDETRYVRDFIKPLRDARSLPNDLLARYAITLPATDAEISAQLKAVRTYWNKASSMSGGTFAAQTAKMCRAEDERLREQHGPKMEKQAWWGERQVERRSAAQESITSLADELEQTYGKLGVVTAGTLDGFAGKLGLTRTDAVQAAEQAGLTLVDGVTLPDSVPRVNFKALLDYLSECAVSSVPELIHPGAGPFSLIDRYVCISDPARRLDAVAIEAQIAEADKRRSATEDARRAALAILRRAVTDGVNLHDIALYHLIKVAAEYVPPSMRRAAEALEKAGLVRRDAAVIAVLLGDQSAASGAAGLGKVRSLLDSGRLNEARQAALNLPAEHAGREEAIKKVDAAREHLDALLAEVRQVLQVPDEGRAAALLREAAAISLEDAKAELAAVPPAPPSSPRAVCDGETVKLFWQPAAGHDDGTTYVVARTEQRPPAAPGDGSVVYRGQACTCTDTHVPVARAAQYGVFALADRRPGSRPATVAVTLLPPVSQLEADVGPSDVTVHWSAHPAAQEVRVARSTQGVPSAPVAVTGNSCRLTGLQEGRVQHFEVTAVYRGPDGGEMLSAAAQINATPRSEAQPISELRARLVDVGGAVRVRVAWKPVDNSEVRIMRSDAPPSWQFGTWVGQEEMAQFGQEVSGRRITETAETVIEADLPPGVHHLVPFSIGGTGIVMGRPVTVGVTNPVRHLMVTSFDTYATVSWEWPPTAQLAEVSWAVDNDADCVVIGQAQYRSQGGGRVPLGRGPCTIEVRAMILADGDSFRSPPVQAVVDSVTDVAISYTVSAGPNLGPFGGRSKKVTFSCNEGCEDVQVRMVALPGRVMPARAEGGIVLLEATLALKPDIPAEHHVTVPRPVKRPYWVRCFVVSGRARLIDPPISSLKET